MSSENVQAIIAGGCGVLSKIGGVKEYHGVHTTPIQEEGKNMPLTGLLL